MGQDRSNLFEKNIFATMPEGIRPGGLMLTERLVDCCNFQNGAKVVDVGCGTGSTVQYLRDVWNLDASGVDLSAVLLERGKERRMDLPVVQSPGEDLPFVDHSVDGVLAECSLSVMRSVSKVLAEINRILIPGGKLGITDLYALDESCCNSTCHPSGVLNYNEIVQVLLDHGFEIMVFEDQSKLLKEFIAGFIMEYGSTDELWHCVGMEKTDKKINKVGYYLLIAKKCS